jgi:hypothetical protein
MAGMSMTTAATAKPTPAISLRVRARLPVSPTSQLVERAVQNEPIPPMKRGNPASSARKSLFISGYFTWRNSGNHVM